jgi:RNA polymerase sigma-70 factor (ECF subfamily)
MSEESQATVSTFEAFYRVEQPKMVALAIALTGVPEAGRDLAQESMLKAFRAWPSVSQMDRPGAWARRVTINAATSWHRRNGRERVAHLRLGHPGMAETPESEGQLFWRAVRALPERQRAVVALYYLEDLSVGEVAAALDVPTGTVKSSLSRARATLAAALGVSAGVDIEEGR